MIERNARASRILNRFIGGGCAGLAVVERAGAQPEAIWLPPSISTEPIFLAYSITKTIIAALIILLEQERRLRIDDPLARWFPRIAGSQEISLRQLLNHTAGVPDYGPLPQS